MWTGLQNFFTIRFLYSNKLGYGQPRDDTRVDGTKALRSAAPWPGSVGAVPPSTVDGDGQVVITERYLESQMRWESFITVRSVFCQNLHVKEFWKLVHICHSHNDASSQVSCLLLTHSVDTCLSSPSCTVVTSGRRNASSGVFIHCLVFLPCIPVFCVSG